MKRSRESGYALLLVYAMAATVAILLLREVPRVAFEAQRDKEQLLIDHGEQYTRAVTLFVRKFNRFPADFDALQSTQNLRFLRHKYKDPMTGKDDWRIVHVGPGGVFTDSLIYGKPKTPGQQPADQQNFIMQLAQTGGDQGNANQQGVNVGTRLRQSDQAGAPGDPNNPAQNGPPQLDPNGLPIQSGFPGQPNQPGLAGQFPGQPFSGQQQQPGAGGPLPGSQTPGQQFPFQPFPGGTPLQMNGVPGQQSGLQSGNAPTNSAGNIINQLLTTPRPGGLNGLGGVQQGGVDQNGNPISGAPGTGTSTAGPVAPAAQTIIGGGIAGVASKLEQDGIKIYKDQTSYHKWEFVYDISKDKTRSGGTVPQAAPPPGTPIGGAPGTPSPTGTPAPNAATTTSPTSPVTSP